ncbi:LPXTG cell wall anchor domain-containing protein [Actinoallomurus sp. NPDC050550]|uniref:LPXTG cell wall anchor domain-containing protein n=1 Tax=Actinoallomurus sp. NPDC050550 TaxID=3154937 RepID=UPI0033EB985D
MRPARKAVTATVAAVVATGLGAAPAAAQGIDVTPNTPHAGQRIHISVPGCSVGPTPHIAKSAAFTHDVTLYGKADTGDGDPRLKKDLPAGTYAITASCGNGRTVRGQIVVAARAGRPETPGKPTHKPVTSQATPGGASPHPTSSTTTLSASPAASQSKKSSNMPFLAIVGVMAVLIFGGAGLLFARRRRN